MDIYVVQKQWSSWVYVSQWAENRICTTAAGYPLSQLHETGTACLWGPILFLAKINLAWCVECGNWWANGLPLWAIVAKFWLSHQNVGQVIKSSNGSMDDIKTQVIVYGTKNLRGPWRFNWVLHEFHQPEGLGKGKVITSASTSKEPSDCLLLLTWTICVFIQIE